MKEYNLGEKDRIYYRKNSLKNGRLTLFFVHGVSGSSSAWEKYEKLFEKEYNIVSIDLRGHGKSFRPMKFEEYSIGCFADDLGRLIKKENLKKIIFISHSFGNFPVLEFLKRHSSIIQGAIFVSPDYAPKNTRIARLTRPILKFLPAMNKMLGNQKKGGHVNYKRYVGAGDWNLFRSYADISNTGLKSYLNALAQSYFWSAEEVLKTIKIPVLIVHGKKDTIFPVSIGKAMAKKIKGARLEIIEEADHIIVLNFFDKLSRLIKDFLKENYK